ncbi:beta-1,4-N-acetylgalactosaminyltransferase bre-4-like [Mya arenaria]|uniref:beta-1,4-N-acetylgalactosaminyltransferase bre-4-like n=1 Tax=Mya arenaria TaxID=6604 RepID=UPI0022E1D6C4|nr:beta-1,4-N-acetylgalactosaminyltransferase bre-4-like [Mya arenaria]
MYKIVFKMATVRLVCVMCLVILFSVLSIGYMYGLLYKEPYAEPLELLSSIRCSMADKLQGPLLNISEPVSNTKLRDVKFKEVQPGGVYRQNISNCTDTQSVAIIIPYRDRKMHLDTLVRHLHSLLQKQYISYGIYVSELAYPTMFNKGILMNVAYVIARYVGNHNCFIFHDVDLILADDRNLYICDKKPKHMSSYNTKYADHGGVPYKEYIGGVLALTASQFRAVNGFSNMMFGWGGSDDLMFLRIQEKRLGLTRVSAEYGRYYALPHDSDHGNPVNKAKFEMMDISRKRTDNDGLSNLGDLYKLVKMEQRPLYTWIYIRCNKTEIMRKYLDIRT